MRPVPMPFLAVCGFSALLTTLGCSDDARPTGPLAAKDSSTQVVHAAFVSPSGHVGYYVAPNGTSTGTGSWNSPWDLATGLAGASGRVKPGDTVWVRGGRYVGHFNSYVAGTAAAPVVVRAYPGERATIDGNSSGYNPLVVRGAWSVIWGLEVMDSNPDRYHTRPQCVYTHGPHQKYVNMVVHDCKIGFTYSNESPGSEIYGSLIFNNGYQGDTKAYGYAIYAKNDGAYEKSIVDNVIFSQFSYGLHVYTDAGSGQLKNIRIEGNALFNNGALARSLTSAANILMGGGEPAAQIKILNNAGYYSAGIGGTNLSLGYSSTQNVDATVTGNYLVGASTVLSDRYWQTTNIGGNTFIGSGRIVSLLDNTPAGQSFSGNTHVGDPLSTAWAYLGTGYTWLTWKTKTGLGATDVVTATKPTATKVIVRPNRYEPGRANVIVYNWGKRGSVTADMSRVLRVGDRYQVHSAQDFYGTPVASGSYGGGSITIPMTAVQPVQPIGGSPTPAKATGPDFDVFVVTKVAN